MTHLEFQNASSCIDYMQGELKWQLELFEDVYAFNEGEIHYDRENNIFWCNLICCGYLGAPEYTLPKAIKPYYERAVQDARSDYEKEHGVNLDELEWGTPEGDEHLEAYYDYEQECLMEGGTYFYKVIFSWDNEANTLVVAAYLNTDFEYGRDYISWLPLVGGGQADQTRGQKYFIIPSDKLEDEDFLHDMCTDIINHLGAQ